MLATQLGPISSCTKLAERNEMPFLDMFLVHDTPKSPAYEQERRQKKGLLQPGVAEADQGKKGEEEWGEEEGGLRGL